MRTFRNIQGEHFDDKKNTWNHGWVTEEINKAHAKGGQGAMKPTIDDMVKMYYFF